MNVDELTIGEAKRIAAAVAPLVHASDPRPENGPRALGRHIVVLQRGWVAVGDLTVDGDQCVISDASIVRRWGTTKGLGELAERGPLPNTSLDPAPSGIRCHVYSIVCTFPCNASAWR
jgi:hypothetical protein